MDKTTTKSIEDKKEWEAFLEDYPGANFLQSWHWGEFYEALGEQVFRLGFYQNDRLIGLMLCVTESAKRGKYLTVPGGPLINWENPELIEQFVKEIKGIAKESNCVFVRVRPQLESNELSKRIFSSSGFVNAPMHLHAELTSQLDITRTEEELLSRMRKSTRYEIKKANSLGIRIDSTKDSSEIKSFYDLHVLTSKRQGFVPFTHKFLNGQFSVFSEAGKALLYSATLDRKLLAQAIIIFYGNEAVYHYGASTDEGRKYPGAYLVQWEAIKEAKKRKMQRFNFWGVSPLDNPNHRFYGLSLFKRGFGGKDFEYLHAQDLVIDSKKYILNSVVENFRRRIRNVGY